MINTAQTFDWLNYKRTVQAYFFYLFLLGSDTSNNKDNLTEYKGMNARELVYMREEMLDMYVMVETIEQIWIL